MFFECLKKCGMIGKLDNENLCVILWNKNVLCIYNFVCGDMDLHWDLIVFISLSMFNWKKCWYYMFSTSKVLSQNFHYLVQQGQKS